MLNGLQLLPMIFYGSDSLMTFSYYQCYSNGSDSLMAVSYGSDSIMAVGYFLVHSR